MTDTTTDRMNRAQRANEAMVEFIGPALEVMRTDYMDKLRDVAAKHPMRGEPLAMVEKLSTALKIVDQIEVQMRALIADGTVAQADADRASNIARLNTEQRRYAGY